MIKLLNGIVRCGSICAASAGLHPGFGLGGRVFKSGLNEGL